VVFFFSQVIIFEDSLSDTGTWHNLREVLTANLGGSAVSSIHGGTNHAFGPFATIPGQVVSYQMQTTKADPDALYTCLAVTKAIDHLHTIVLMVLRFLRQGGGSLGFFNSYSCDS
jgi:hypothetical protein